MTRKVSLSKWTAENFKRVSYLHDSVRPLFVEFLCRIAIEGIYIRIPDDGAYRTSDQQRALYNKVPKVTWVLCPYSWHCHGLAIDLVPMWRLGTLEYQALWSGHSYERIARIGYELGIDWGYSLWGVDKPHFHYSGGVSIEHLAAGAGIPTPSFTPCKKPRDLLRALDRLDVDLPVA